MRLARHFLPQQEATSSSLLDRGRRCTLPFAGHRPSRAERVPVPPQRLPVAFVFAQSQADTRKERESLEPRLKEKAEGGLRDHSVTRRDSYESENLKHKPLFSLPLHLPSYLTGKGQGWSTQFLGSGTVAG